MLKKIIKNYLLIILLSIIFSFYLFELYLLIDDKLENHRIHKTFYKENNKEIDIRSKVEVFDELKKKDFVVSLDPSVNFNKNNKIYPLSGISKKKTIHCKENGYFSFFQSDRYGFNNLDKGWDEDVVDYFLIGDSFLDGSCVNEPYDISSVLRKLSQKVVLNLSYSGNGPLTQYATLREYLRPNVDRVLWFFYEGNDLLDLEREISNKFLKNYLDSNDFNQNLIFRQEEIDEVGYANIFDSLASARDELFHRKKNERIYFQLLKFLRLNETKKTIRKSFVKKKEISTYTYNIFDEILRQSIDFTKKNNSEFIFIYIPDSRRFIKNTFGKSSLDLTFFEIKKIVEKNEVHFFDLNELLFKEEKDPKIFFPFGISMHFNIFGHKKVAEIIYKITHGE